MAKKIRKTDPYEKGGVMGKERGFLIYYTYSDRNGTFQSRSWVKADSEKEALNKWKACKWYCMDRLSVEKIEEQIVSTWTGYLLIDGSVQLWKVSD